MRETETEKKVKADMNYGIITGQPEWTNMEDGRREYLPETTYNGHVVFIGVDPIGPEDIERSDVTGLAYTQVKRNGKVLCGIYGVYMIEAF